MVLLSNLIMNRFGKYMACLKKYLQNLYAETEKSENMKTGISTGRTSNTITFLNSGQLMMMTVVVVQVQLSLHIRTAS